MNLQYLVLANKKTIDNEKLNDSLQDLANSIKENKIKISNKKFVLGDMSYYRNCLPVIPETRDLLKKPVNVCNVRINWEKEDFGNLDANTIFEKLKPQYGFCVDIVDVGYTRNNFKNKESIWIVFDSKNSAEKNLRVFNKMFRTAIEQNAIDEYKKFKQNPMKRPLTYDKLVDNAYELYDLVDRGEE